MIQQGGVFKLKARWAEGIGCAAYRYRVAGQGSARLQVFISLANLPPAPALRPLVAVRFALP